EFERRNIRIPVISPRHPFVENVIINLWARPRRSIVIDNSVESRVGRHETVPDLADLEPGILLVREDVAAVIPYLVRRRHARIVIDTPEIPRSDLIISPQRLRQPLHKVPPAVLNRVVWSVIAPKHASIGAYIANV